MASRMRMYEYAHADGKSAIRIPESLPVISPNKFLEMAFVCLAAYAGATLATVPDFKLLKKVEAKVESIESRLSGQVRTENVIGNSEPETFYTVNGQRVYLKIDGKSVEDYVRGK